MLFSRQLATKFENEIRFIRVMLDEPKAVGAVLPTSSKLAKKMARLANNRAELPVLELGPGTGVITKALLDHNIKPQDLYSIEYSDKFYGFLKKEYPGVNFIHGDAFNLKKTFESVDLENKTFDCAISGLPLLNFPVSERIKYIDQLLDWVTPGRPVIQFSYGLSSPVPEKQANFKVQRYATVMGNLPPARIWIYHR